MDAISEKVGGVIDEQKASWGVLGTEGGRAAFAIGGICCLTVLGCFLLISITTPWYNINFIVGDDENDPDLQTWIEFDWTGIHASTLQGDEDDETYNSVFWSDFNGGYHLWSLYNWTYGGTLAAFLVIVAMCIGFACLIPPVPSTEQLMFLHVGAYRIVISVCILVGCVVLTFLVILTTMTFLDHPNRLKTALPNGNAGTDNFFCPDDDKYWCDSFVGNAVDDEAGGITTNYAWSAGPGWVFSLFTCLCSFWLLICIIGVLAVEAASTPFKFGLKSPGADEV